MDQLNKVKTDLQSLLCEEPKNVSKTVIDKWKELGPMNLERLIAEKKVTLEDNHVGI